MIRGLLLAPLFLLAPWFVIIAFLVQRNTGAGEVSFLTWLGTGDAYLVGALAASAVVIPGCLLWEHRTRRRLRFADGALWLVFMIAVAVMALMPVVTRLAGRHDVILADGAVCWRGPGYRSSLRRQQLAEIEQLETVKGRPFGVLLLADRAALFIDEPMRREQADALAGRLRRAVAEAHGVGNRAS